MSEYFRYYLRVRYFECDAQKVVFNARYGDYIDLAATEYLRAIGLVSLAASEESIDFQVVKQTTQWKAPARFDDVLELSVYASHLGNTSFTLTTDIRIAGDDRVIVTAETVNVAVDPITLSKKSLSDKVRVAMQRGGPGLIVDHAGYFPPDRSARSA